MRFTVDWIGLGEEVQPEAIHGSIKQPDDEAINDVAHEPNSSLVGNPAINGRRLTSHSESRLPSRAVGTSRDGKPLALGDSFTL